MPTQPLRVLLVDDEPLGRAMVRGMLQTQADVTIVAECENGYEAIAALQKNEIDLVFLDVQMPEMDGFGVLAAIPAERLPHVIFVTAYDQYAVRAFEVHALDYLLKPFDSERFQQALERARQQIHDHTNQDLPERLLSLLNAQTQYLERLIIKDSGRVFFLKTAEIEWIEAEGNYVALHIGKKQYLFREAISRLETQLDPRRFSRIHRSTMVNLDCVRELQPWFRGDYKVILHDGTELKLSHRFRENFVKHFGGSL